MEILSEAEKQLSENLGKCRCCFRMLIDDRRAVKITEEIKVQFLQLTNVELLVSEIFADRICQLCASDLTVFSNLRDDLISKQKTLYELAGLDESCFNFNSTLQAVEDEPEMVDEQADFDMNFETIDQEDDTSNVYMEEEVEAQTTEDGSFLEEDETATKMMVKIEKLGDKSSVHDSMEQEEDVEESTSFDYFEEIVDSESGDQKYFQNDSEKYTLISCDMCGIEVPKTHMVEHIQVMHKSFTCAECDRTFQSKISLKRHTLENHSSENTSRSKKRHFCPLCPKDYDYRKQLEDHIRSFHDKERNSECTICHKYFYHRDIKKHIEHVHGEKNISCATCGKKYTCIENLRLHQRYHLPPAYVCSYPDCNKKFHQKVLWEHHEKKHTDVKPYNCEQENCQQSFYSLRDLKRHQSRVHEKTTRKCFLCDMQFTRKDKYRLHLLKKHNELSDQDRESILDQVRTMKWNES